VPYSFPHGHGTSKHNSREVYWNLMIGVIFLDHKIQRQESKGEKKCVLTR